MKKMNIFKKIFFTVVISLFSVSLFSCNSNKDEDLGTKVEERTLNFYALNDFHGALLYDESYEQTGLSKIGRYLIDKKSSDPENTFIISSGDMFQGGAESNITYGKIVIDMMNEIGFDSMTLGNHEFDWGETKLKEMSEEMNFPLLSNNTFYASDSSQPTYLSNYTIIKKEGIKVGIIGTIMPDINSSIIATISDNFLFEDNLELIKKDVETLRNENCDIVILSAHDGEYSRYKDLVGYIDALFLGHDHEVKSGYIDETNKLLPYIEGGTLGEYLSNISLDLELVNNHYEVVSASYKNYDTYYKDKDLFSEYSVEIEDIYETYKDTIEPIRDEVLYNFTSAVTRSDFGYFAAYSLRNYATNTKPMIPCISGALNYGGIRSDIPVGEFTYGDLIKVYPFENTLTLLRFDKINSYNQFKNSGVLINSSSETLTHNNSYYVATIDYVAYGSSGKNANELIDTGIFCKDIVKEYLLKEGYKKVN